MTRNNLSQLALLLTVLTLTILIACENPCWEPLCYESTVLTFSLLDSAGNDLVFSDSVYFPDQLSIQDSLGNAYPIVPTLYSSYKLDARLSSQYQNYQILIDSTILDHFKVAYKQTHEECCGLTYWIEDIEFATLRTDSLHQYFGYLNIYIE